MSVIFVTHDIGAAVEVTDRVAVMYAGRMAEENENFGVSRTPVREALKQLTIIGLVVMRPNRGAMVASLAPQKLDSLFEAIGELDAACAPHGAA